MMISKKKRVLNILIVLVGLVCLKTEQLSSENKFNSSATGFDPLQEAFFHSSQQGKHKESFKIDHRKYGYINWSLGYFVGLVNEKIEFYKLQKNKNYHSSPQHINIDHRLSKKTKSALLATMLDTKLDSNHNIHDFYQNNPPFKIALLTHLQKYIKHHPPIQKDMQFTKMLMFPIYGKHSITSLLYSFYDEEILKPAMMSVSTPSFEKNTSYSSLVIDLRESFQVEISSVHRYLGKFDKNRLDIHLSEKINYDPNQAILEFQGTMSQSEKKKLIALQPKNKYYHESIEILFQKSKRNKQQIYFRPSIFPKIFDSQNQLLHSPKSVPLSMRNQFPYLHYTTSIQDTYRKSVGDNPLFVIANKVKGKHLSDIILSQEDSALFFSKKENIEALYQGKLFLIVK